MFRTKGEKMSIQIGKYNFESPYPYSSASMLEDKAGIYAIIDARTNGNFVVDVGESAAIKSRIENHDRSDCWRRNQSGTLKVAVLYTSRLHQSGRIEIEQELREQFNPVYGVR
jgi:hypothetical protein